MAKKKPLTAIQQEFKRELINLRRRAQSAFKAGYLSEEAFKKIPERITDEYVRKHASTRAIKSLRKLTTKKIRTPNAAELYREAYQNELEQSQPEQETPERQQIRRTEIINTYINELFDYIDEKENETPEGKKISEANEFRRTSNLRQVRNVFQQAIGHYGEDQVNEFLADSDNMYKLNSLVDKIAVLYLLRDQAQADVLIVEFASVFNGGPLSTEQMQSLEEAGAFDFYEDDLL